MTEKEPITGKAEFEEQKQMAGKMKSIEEKRQGLVTEKFTVGYGKKVILSDVNLMAEPGKVLKSNLGNERARNRKESFYGNDGAYSSGADVLPGCGCNRTISLYRKTWNLR